MLFDGRTIKATHNFNDAYIDNPVYNRMIERVARLSEPRRYIEYGRLAQRLAHDAAPWVAFAAGTRRDLVSARVGCVVEQPISGLDLAALCLRR